MTWVSFWWKLGSKVGGKFSKWEYALATIMFTNKYIFGNCTKCWMCEDYKPINKHTWSSKYAMLLHEETFDSIGQTKVFSTLDL